MQTNEEREDCLVNDLKKKKELYDLWINLGKI